MFKSDFFKQNRAKLRAKFDQDILFIFTANGLLQRSGSTTYPFKQDSNFWYLSGIEEPDVLLIMQDSEEYIILPKRSEVYERFNGRIDRQQLELTSAVKKVYDYEQGISKLKTAILSAGKIATFMPLDEYLQDAGFYPNPARRRLVSVIKSINDELELIDVRAQLAKLRMIKEKDEIAAIQQAISITTSAFEKIKSNVSNYRTEKDLMVALTAELLSQGASGHAYDPVVAAGENACTLHYLPKNYQLQPGKLVLIDAGAEFMNYVSDITRTYALTPPTERQFEIYETVMDIRKFALEQLKPGLIFKLYEQAVKKHAAKVIKKLNLKSESTKYYPHATSHFLGIDVHDVADYEATLKPNMVITVEPGIYIEEEGIGIRIEDNILITKNGYKNLSEQLPRELI